MTETDLTLSRSDPFDPAPLLRLLTDRADLARVNPNAKQPFDPLEWQEKWLAEPDDAAFYLLDPEGREVGFFALRAGVGPEMRHLVYVFVAEEWRGGTGAHLADLAESAARDLGALTLTLKVEDDNPKARAIYDAAGFQELGRRGGMTTMSKDLDQPESR